MSEAVRIAATVLVAYFDADAQNTDEGEPILRNRPGLTALVDALRDALANDVISHNWTPGRVEHR